MREPWEIPDWDYYDDAHAPVSDSSPIYVREIGAWRSRRWYYDNISYIEDLQHWKSLPLAYVGVDESGDLKSADSLVIAATICTDLEHFRWDYNQIRERHADRLPLDKEPKFTGSGEQRVAVCEELIDLVFTRSYLRFGAIVVPKRLGSARHFTNNKRDHTSRIFGHEYFLGELLEHRLHDTHRHEVWLDQHDGLAAARTADRLVQFYPEIIEASFRDSRREPLIQVSDIIGGAIAAAYNNPSGIPTEATKAQIQARVLHHLRPFGVDSLRGGLWSDDFNVWEFRAPVSRRLKTEVA